MNNYCTDVDQQFQQSVDAQIEVSFGVATR